MWIQNWVTCTKQPRGAFRISQSNPLARGLVFVAIGGKAINLVNGRPGTIVGTVGTDIEDNKRLFKTATGAANRIDFPSSVPATHIETSYGSVFYHTGPGTFQYLILRDISNPPVHLFGIAAAGNLQVSFGSSGVIPGATTVPANVWHVASGSTPPTGDLAQANGKLYLDGVKLATGGGNNATSYTSPASTGITLNGRALDNNRQLAGAQALAVVWDKILTNAEHYSWSVNPWQLFEELSTPLWAATFAAGTTFTITPSGGITLAGAPSQVHTHVQTPGGGVVLGGTAPITFVPFGTTFTITPTGGVTFAGSPAQTHTRIFTCAGGFNVAGTVPDYIKIRVQTPSGLVQFAGSSPLIFIPAGGVITVPQRTVVGSGV